MFDKLRRRTLTGPLFEWAKANLPPLSATEREALGAGDVWWDGDLFFRAAELGEAARDSPSFAVERRG